MLSTLRRKVVFIFASVVLMLSLVVPAFTTPALADQVAMFTVGANVYTALNGTEYIMDVAPYISNGRVFVPVHYLANALGATATWDGTTQTDTVTSGSNTVVLTIGSTTETVNGTGQTMDVAPEIINGEVMLPARWIAEPFGYQLGWNPSTQQVAIVPNGQNSGNGQTTTNPPTITAPPIVNPPTQVPTAPTGPTPTNTTSNGWGQQGIAMFIVGGPIYQSLDGQSHKMDVSPFIQDGRTYVPVRFLVDALGINDSDVSFNPQTETVAINTGTVNISMTVNSDIITVNSVNQVMDVTPIVKYNRVMLPASWLVKNLGYQVAWNPQYQEVAIVPNQQNSGNSQTINPPSLSNSNNNENNNQSNPPIITPPSAVSPSIQVPPAPSWLTANAVTNNNGLEDVTWTWNPVIGASGYNLYINSNTPTVSNIGTTSFTLDNVTPLELTQGRVYVTAVNQAGESPPCYITPSTTNQPLTPTQAPSANNQNNQTTTFTIGANVYQLKGVDYVMSQAPIISNGSVYMPVRYLASALGISNVGFNPTTQTVLLISGNTTVYLTVGAMVIEVNGVYSVINGSPFISGGVTFLPIAPVIQAFGGNSTWNPSTQELTITPGNN